MVKVCKSDGQGTFAGTQGNGELAPIPALQMAAIERGIDLDFSLDQLLRQTDDNLKKGFRAIKMKVGRSRLSEDLERVRAMREHLGADFPLMVDANMRWVHVVVRTVAYCTP
jgi:L-alanine-DL-glutamate epimerase-like enolase superfamily enzyme